MIVLELTDHIGKCECALFGGYVDQFRQMFAKIVDVMPVVVLQFAKVKVFRDKISLHNVMSTTRLLLNPDIDDVVSFRHSLAIHGLETSQHVSILGPGAKPSFEEEFLRTYPVKTIVGLHEVVDDGTFIVAATIVGLVDEENWWYAACKCHKSVPSDSDAYYCSRCDKHVFQMIYRFRVKFHVTNGSGDATFVLFDGHMNYLVGEHCVGLVFAANVVAGNGGSYPFELLALMGSRFLFKVEKTTSLIVSLDDSFKVKRVCNDSDVLKSFDLMGSDSNTSEVAIFLGCFVL
ncbi:hypothetical protein P8452_13236 [Trifolium repens]|nr:hypothetical protein P8452_13236 [Trifolium repens]